MGLKNILILLTQVIIASCQQEPFISFISKDQYTDIGGRIEIRCTVQFNLDFPVIWMRKPDLVISSGLTKIVPDERYAVTREGDTFILTMTDLQETDSNTYQCQVLKSAGDKITADAFVGIRRPPVINDDSSRDINVVEGVNVTLHCDATGYPEPVITWRRLGDSAIAGGSSLYIGKELTIPRISKSDRGIYVCVAENGMSQGDRRNVAVQVEFKPEVTVPLATIGQMFLYNIEFECNIEAFPPPAVNWVFDGEIISDNMHYSVTNFLSTGDKVNTKLKIHSIEQRQFGRYQCKASNRLGTGIGEVTLLETYVPNERFAGEFNPLTTG